MNVIDLGGTSPLGPRARMRNRVAKVSGGMGGARLAGGSFQRGAAPPRGGGRGGGRHGGGGKHHGRRRHGGGYYPYYPYGGYGYGYPYLYPYYGYGYGYGYGNYASDYPRERETVPSACCYNVETGSLYCPGSEYDGAPAFAEATRMYQGRPMSYVTSPQLGQAQWFWNCPTETEPSAITPGGGPQPPRAPRSARLRAA